ncbi:2' O-ribose methyltransferase [Neocucurbitaria cava]|uniref:rRNA methyltransferase 2, mitochondrial n=1 Tax=Neocucurbitaria cava TaxID=798079 RepID=A0A9W9CPW7_9PLEO|nr:2' O-ribose methyltransferase [Neocucurbitaria cava]
MLSRRVFKQLTDSFLLGPGYSAAVVPCLAAQCQACRACNRAPAKPIRHASSSSSTRWKSRQGSDFFAREARVQGLKSRAAFKLLEVLCCYSEDCSRADSKQLNEKHKLFKPGQTVVDLVAVNRTTPDGRVIGIDLIPAQPPRGVSTIQGNFLSPIIQDEVRAYVRDPDLGRPRKQITSRNQGRTEEELDEMERGYVDIERQARLDGVEIEPVGQPTEDMGQGTIPDAKLTLKERDIRQGRAVDVVLSDMSEPWDQTAGFYKKSLSDPYFRMMNTSGNAFRDHAGSMESKEAYFVALRRKETPTKEDVFRE